MALDESVHEGRDYVDEIEGVRLYMIKNYLAIKQQGY